ncbi:MAG: methyltransferase domain-containing protein [Candidatus Rehaiarchaeum fermentans]|nr:methyltransferase domain-containing protein [Candidatus Rehaiarchaeum fermentans]
MFWFKPKIKIEKEGEEVFIKYNDYTYSLFNLNSLFTQHYWDYFTPLPLLFDLPKVLIIGLGGGTIAYQIENIFNNAKIDAIEPNEEMIKIAKQRLKRTNILKGDGYKILSKTDKIYNIIILDAYSNDYIPEEFISREFMSNSYNHLEKRGILAINYALTPPNLAREDKLINYMKEFYKIYIVKNLGKSNFNEIYIGSKNVSLENEYKNINNELTKNYPDLITCIESYKNCINYGT